MGLCTLWCVGVGVCVVLAVRDPGPDLRHPAVTGSAAATVAWVVVAWVLLLVPATRLARLAWTFGFLMLLIHLVLAFGVGHRWSHAEAVERIREVGGTGAGILVNYLFTLVWGADVVWWWADPAGYAVRPRRVGRFVHGFAIFMVVNGTVVFGPEERRWWYAAVLGVLAVLWWRRSAQCE